MGFVVALLFLLSAVAVFALVSRLISQYQTLHVQLLQVRQQRKDVIDFLNHFTRKLATVEEIDDAMQLVAHYLSDMLRAESLAVFVVDVDPADGQRKLRGSAVAGLFPAFHQTLDVVLTRPKHRLEHLRHEYIEFGEGILGRLAEEGTGEVLIERVSEDRRKEELPRDVDSLMAVTMSVDNRFLGVICAVNCKEEGRSFNAEDMQLFHDLSYQAALASNLINIYSERSRQQRIVQELEFGRELQQSLLPSAAPEWGRYRFATFGEAALEVAGDYYDFVEIDDDRLMIVVADATGKGIPACMLMAMCRSFVRSLVESYAGLERFLGDLNRRLYQDTDLAHFVTMAVIVVDKATHICEYGCGGHTPLLLRKPDGRTVSMKPSGPALGLLPPDLCPGFDTISFTFGEQMELLLFTDGITEALNEAEEEFGIDRLAAIWGETGLSGERMCETIVTKVKQFVGSAVQFDDQTIIMVTRSNVDQDDNA